jgi:xanthine dehydrogenase accessory factor
MNYQVIVVDPETAGASTPEADEIVTDLSQMAGKITPFTYVVVATHGHFDELALEQALRAPAPYVALVASKTRSASVLDYLAARGLTAAELARLKCPAGLDIRAGRGDEIALSIMAEIVQKRRAARPIPQGDVPVDLNLRLEEAKPPAEPIPSCKGTYLQGDVPVEVIDPVCGMTVQVEGAKYMSEYEGRHYYFCAAGCKLAFDKTPKNYV